MRVYISGAITNDPDYVRKFFRADNLLHKAGYATCNPVLVSKRVEMKMEPDKARYEDYLKADIKELLECDAITFLPGWEKSEGAKLEKHIAEVLKKTVVECYEVDK